MKLLVFKGGDQINSIDLNPGTTYIAGRKEDCDIQLENLPGISREHFQIEDNGEGQWVVNVLSKVTYLKFEGEEAQEIPLESGQSFSLPPYRFQYEENVQQEDSFVPDISSVDQPVAAFDNESSSSFNDSTETAEDIPSDKTFVGNEEKTSIQTFSGLPYIKIIGQNGKKSEFFRLEGNLWVAGRDDAASIYISDPSASLQHFELSRTDKGFFITDLGSPIGTMINGQKVDPHNPVHILSGDIINIGQQSLQFELRDQAFKKKVSNIPLHMYQNPLVFFDQETAMVSSEPEVMGAGHVEEVKDDPVEAKNKKRLPLLITAALVVVAAAAMTFMESPKEENVVKNESTDPFSQLSLDEKKQVVQTYKLAKQLFLNGNTELALVQINTLHSIIPQYKDSRKIEDYCINSRELKRQQALIEQQRREEEEIARQVKSYIAQCSQRFAKSYDFDGAKACLEPARQLDPNHPAIAQILSEITARKDERAVRMKIAKERADKVRRGNELYERARQYHKKKNFLKAIEAYENHIHSGLPDPKRLVKKSKRSLSSIESMIKTKKNSLMNDAQSKYGSSQLKDAVKFAKKAQRVDPYDHTISEFIVKLESELTNKVKNIYNDSLIEERFGNLESSRIKWEEIMRIDIETGKYYKKAQGKMKEYGFKH